ncbi:MAG: hypothetical protein E7311_04505 [Clostridiales bacterium]|nr:hypothetical protein [Clostridiales bacterium]
MKIYLRKKSLEKNGYNNQFSEPIIFSDNESKYLLFVVSKTGIVDDNLIDLSYIVYSIKKREIIEFGSEKEITIIKNLPSLTNPDFSGINLTFEEHVRLKNIIWNLIDSYIKNGKLSDNEKDIYKRYLLDRERVESNVYKRIYRYFIEQLFE